MIVPCQPTIDLHSTMFKFTQGYNLLSNESLPKNVRKPNTYGVEPDDGTVCLIVFSMLLSEYNPIGELNCLC